MFVSLTLIPNIYSRNIMSATIVTLLLEKKYVQAVIGENISQLFILCNYMSQCCLFGDMSECYQYGDMSQCYLVMGTCHSVIS